MQRDALFDLLANSSSAVCVTSNRRLARSLAAEFDYYQVERSRTVWQTPQILPFTAFVASLLDNALHDPDLKSVPVPLTSVQERALWEAVVSDSELGVLSSAAGAALAADAWSLAHQWNVAARVRRYTAVADTRVFVNWAADYHRRVDAMRATDQARLPDVVRDYVEAGTIAAPSHLLLAGFDETTPQQQQLLDALVTRGTVCERYEPARHDATPLRAPCLDERDENEKVADWVAARLAANARTRIGIVVPQLAARRRLLTATLDAALVPDRPLTPAGARPYTVSLGGALSDVALIAFFLRSLRLALGSVSFEHASAMLRSPYLAGAVNESDARSLIDAQLRGRCQRTVDFDRIFDAAQASTRDCGVEVAQLLTALRALSHWRRQHATRSRRPSEWAAAFTHALQSITTSAGVGEFGLDSNEYQALARWQELLLEFAALDRTVGRIASDAALGQLERIAKETIFQPDGGTPPVQILGVLEANGLTFDHVWIMGLTSDAWPPSPQPDPLLPIELQHAAGMPGASATIELRRAQRQLQRLLQSAQEVIVSHATIEGDRQIAPSPMIALYDEWIALRRAARLIDPMAPAALVSSRDAVAPAWGVVTPVRGGAAILQNQAACPFRAFAIHRLSARALESPHDGFDYRERGQLVHDTLAHFWGSLPEPTRNALAATTDAHRRALLRDAAEAAHQRLQRRRGALSPAFTELESTRLVRVIEQWLQHEITTRSEFRVAAIEDARTMQVGPLTVTGRLDRVDEYSDGARIVIDYKTGGAKNPGWLEARPDEPQLPLYLVASEPAARAIAFARVRTGDVGFTGLAAEPDLLPVRSNFWKGQHVSWSALVEHWSSVLERLAVQFAAGDAAVDPKRLPQTCRYCDLPTLCRINERGGVVTAGAADDDDGTPWVRDDE
ncbi:MAG TPA: PD-(D/E)XK nuclease family protein [Burkholderiaceae bacterium]|nr:PD-(D/E)XK nuclease family protein [Burkholderiaceae bacterium]